MTTAYFDTSALIPLVIEEPGSAVCARAWEASTMAVASSLAYVEAHTALAQAARMGRITTGRRREAASSFDDLWGQVTSVPPIDAVLQRAAALGVAHGLRGYDAVHCATAMTLAVENMFAVSGDQALLAAWRDLGIVTVDVNQPRIT